MAVKALSGVGTWWVGQHDQVTVGPARLFGSPRVCAGCGRPVAGMSGKELARGVTLCCGATIDGQAAARVLRSRALVAELEGADSGEEA